MPLHSFFMSTSMSTFFSKFPTELEKAKIGLILSALNWGIVIPFFEQIVYWNEAEWAETTADLIILATGLISCLVISVLCALFAITKRRNPLHWALWGLNFNVIAFAVLLFKSKLPKVPEKLQGESE